MVMTMEELFYGESEPVYFAHSGRRTAASEPHVHNDIPEYRSHRMELITFNLTVPMCCARCEDQVRDALFALDAVRDVVCDPRNQRVTVTGCLDPEQALKQVRRVKHGATFRSDASSYTEHRHEASSHRVQQDTGYRRSCVQCERKEQRPHAGQYNRSSGDAYSRSFCPAYRDTAKTYYMSLHPTIATVEMQDW